MLKRRKESGAFWVFLLFILILPFLTNSGLSAQDENLDDFVVSEEPLPDEVPQAADNTSESADDAPIDDVVEDSQPENDEDQPALSADPNELLAKVNGPYRAKKFDNVVKDLSDFEDAVSSSKELAEIFVVSIINSKKPDWKTLNRVAKALGRLDKKSSLANYAQGLYYQNKRKPDAGKALTFFSKAKSAKKPYPDAANAYYMAMVKKFWMILIAIVLLPIIVVANKIKKKKAVQAAVAIDLDGPGVVPGEDAESDLQAVLSGDSGADAKVVDEKTDQSGVPAAAASDVKAEVVAPAPGEQPVSSLAPIKAPGVAPASIEKKGAEVTTAPEVAAQAKDAPASSAPITPGAAQTQPPYAEPSASQPEARPVPAPQGSHATLTAKRDSEIEQARALISPQRRDPVAADPELDEIWSQLCRKALKSKINPHSRSSYEPQAGQQNSFSNARPVGGSTPDFKESSIDLNVTIDLSEESLKDDLMGKLKMLAISDGELRSLLGQKDIRHIPHLIEYVLSRPEPVRLALVARELGHYNDPAVLDTLASLLYHEDPRVALAAIQGLENSKNPQAILHICPFLKSEIPLLAQAGRTALSNFGAVKILKAFIGLAQHPDAKIREAGVFVLSRMKGSQVEQLLIQLLHDDAEEIRQKVILAMAYQKNPAYIEPLREFYRIATGPDKTLSRKSIVYLQGFSTKKK